MIAVLYAPRARASRIRRTSKRLTRDALCVIRTTVVPRLPRRKRAQTHGIRCIYHADVLGTYMRAMAPRDSCTLCPAGPDTTRALHAQATYARRFARDTYKTCPETTTRKKRVQIRTAFRGLISTQPKIIGLDSMPCAVRYRNRGPGGARIEHVRPLRPRTDTGVTCRFEL